MNANQEALVSAYILGVRAKTHEEMVYAVKLAKALENGLSKTEIDQAKLRAELEIDPMKEYHLPDGIG